MVEKLGFSVCVLSQALIIWTTFLARLFEEKMSGYCRHSGVSVSVSVIVWVGKGLG
jgi:hypothetical protein